MAEGEGESLEQWQERWREGEGHDIGFHKSAVHDMLTSYIGQLTNGKKCCRIFVPLCGKTLDMIWLYEQGHEVVGLEAIEMAIEAFFQEQSIKYTVTDVPGIPDAKLYQNVDGKIKIYKSDLFAVNRSILGSFDCIWDRGSLVAIAPNDRIRYSQLMSSLMNEGGRILLESYLYDIAKFKWKNHSPFCVTESDIKSLYEPQAKVEILQRRDVLYDVFRQAGLDWMSAIAVLLTFS